MEEDYAWLTGANEVVTKEYDQLDDLYGIRSEPDDSLDDFYDKAMKKASRPEVDTADDDLV